MYAYNCITIFSTEIVFYLKCVKFKNYVESDIPSIPIKTLPWLVTYFHPK